MCRLMKHTNALISATVPLARDGVWFLMAVYSYSAVKKPPEFCFFCIANTANSSTTRPVEASLEVARPPKKFRFYCLPGTGCTVIYCIPGTGCTVIYCLPGTGPPLPSNDSKSHQNDLKK